MQVMLCLMAMAVLGIALKTGIFFLIVVSISSSNTPVTTETITWPAVNSFLKPFNTSLTWKGFTAKITNWLSRTAAALSGVTITPLLARCLTVAVFLFVTVISAALQNLLL